MLGHNHHEANGHAKKALTCGFDGASDVRAADQVSLGCLLASAAVQQTLFPFVFATHHLLQIPLHRSPPQSKALTCNVQIECAILNLIGVIFCAKVAQVHLPYLLARRPPVACALCHICSNSARLLGMWKLEVITSEEGAGKILFWKYDHNRTISCTPSICTRVWEKSWTFKLLTHHAKPKAWTCLRVSACMHTCVLACLLAFACMQMCVYVHIVLQFQFLVARACFTASTLIYLGWGFLHYTLFDPLHR